MPRTLAFDQGAKPQDVIPLLGIDLGTNEMSADEFARELRLSRSVVYSFRRCLNFHAACGNMTPEKRVDIFDRAYLWLSHNATGPWYWEPNDRRDNSSSSIYIERQSDQTAFAKANPKFKLDLRSDWLDSVAVLRGVLPPPTAQEHFLIWRDNHCGYDIEPFCTTEKGTKRRITFDNAEVEANFLNEIGDHVIQAADRPHSYIEREPYTKAHALSHDLIIKLTNLRGVGELMCDSDEAIVSGFNRIRLGSVSQNRWKVSVRYEKLRNELKASPWGQVFTQVEPGSKYFIATGASPAVPTRLVPADFKDYLAGISDDYAKPYLHGPTEPILPGRHRRYSGMVCAA